FVARFRVENWNAKKEVPYRVVYSLKLAAGRKKEYSWEGNISRDPVDKKELVLASLSCVQQVDGGLARAKVYRWIDRVWFPHADMVPKLAAHKPDLFFFAGDQIYEGNPTPPDRSGGRSSELDYLYKWYLWCWSYGDLVRSTPCICIPDDHDAYHPNIWGKGGEAADETDKTGAKGGFVMPPRWVNMMQETQCSNLPDPYDPTPAKQGIQVYYTSLVWGGIGFAILEDRKFKSPPTLVNAKMTVDSHITEVDYDTRKADVPGAQLLGERQLRFLREFAQDWRGQKMKAALSQTIFCNFQINSRGELAGQLDKDLDSGGWPQSGRKAALHEMRRGFMIHIAGDQHLASTLQHGIDEFEDANWSVCSPAISNFYVRFWNPSYPPVDGKSLGQPFTGRYEDGFHNKITVHAVANPVEKPEPNQFPEPVDLYRKATGYNIVRFNKAERTILVETWPRHVDPRDRRTGTQYPGWPIKIAQVENYGRKAKAFLPTLDISGAGEPVVRVVEDSTGEVVYTLRLKEPKFRPKVFAEGSYTIQVSDPERGKVKTLASIVASTSDSASVLSVKL
ncbi:MAG: alkaline phosphatase D family protein, partial [Limisphaerales bacterium]